MGASFASAATITFTESVTASGSLGSNSFTDALVTLKATGNTSNVTQPFPGFFELEGLAVSINIAGLGTANLTSPGAVLSCRNNSCLSTPPYPDAAAGFGDPDIGYDILDIVDGAFNTYDLATSIGPITGSSLINPSFPHQTDEGEFDIDSAGAALYCRVACVESNNATFTATVGPATPEPATVALVLLGLVGGLASVRLRK
jgi:hypothetical protein